MATVTQIQTRRIDCVSPAATSFLEGEICECGRLRTLQHARRADRLAITFKPAVRGDDRVPDGAIALENLSMFALTTRFTGGSTGTFRSRQPVAGYRFVRDTDTGRVGVERTVLADLSVSNGLTGTKPVDAKTNATLARAAVAMAQSVEDTDSADLDGQLVLPEFWWAWASGSNPVFEPTHTTQAWASTETRIGTMRAWPARMFVRQGRYAAHPLDGSPCPLPGEPLPESWVDVDGVPTPKAQVPDMVYTYLFPFRGRVLRNPAFRVLKDLGIIAQGQSYKAWLDTLSKRNGQGRVYQDPDVEGSRTAQVRANIEAYATSGASADADLWDRLGSACEAMGLHGLEQDDLAEIAMSPWCRLGEGSLARFAAKAACVQVVKLGGIADPATLDFHQMGIDVNLFDLGRAYEPAPPSRVEEVLAQVRQGMRK